MVKLRFPPPAQNNRAVFLSLVILITGLFSDKGQLAWVTPVGLKDFYHFFLYLIGGGGVRFGIALVAFIIALSTWWSHWHKGEWSIETWSFFVIVLWLFLPICVTFLISIWKPVFSPRFLIICLPAALLLLAWGLNEIRYRRIGYAMVMVIVLSAIVPIRAFYAKTGLQDWKSAISYLKQNTRSDDIVFLPDGYCELPFRYYSEHAGLVSNLRIVSSNSPQEVTARAISKTGHVWVISCEATKKGSPTALTDTYQPNVIKEYKGIRIVELGYRKND